MGYRPSLSYGKSGIPQLLDFQYFPHRHKQIRQPWDTTQAYPTGQVVIHIYRILPWITRWYSMIFLYGVYGESWYNV